MAPHADDVNDPPINREDYETIWLSEVCIDKKFIGKGLVKTAYNILFSNPNLSVPRWDLSPDGKEGKKAPLDISYPPMTAQKILYYAWIVRKPYDNSRSIRFHLRNGFHKVADVKSPGWQDLQNPASELYVKEIVLIAESDQVSNQIACVMGNKNP